MDRLRLLLLIPSIALALVLIRAVITGNIHSKYAVTYRGVRPGTFWALWVVLLLPLVAVLFLVFATHLGRPH
jgi:hypothetical protein